MSFCLSPPLVGRQNRGQFMWLSFFLRPWAANAVRSSCDLLFFAPPWAAKTVGCSCAFFFWAPPGPPKPWEVQLIFFFFCAPVGRQNRATFMGLSFFLAPPGPPQPWQVQVSFFFFRPPGRQNTILVVDFLMQKAILVVESWSKTPLCWSNLRPKHHSGN